MGWTLPARQADHLSARLALTHSPYRLPEGVTGRIEVSFRASATSANTWREWAIRPRLDSKCPFTERIDTVHIGKGVNIHVVGAFDCDDAGRITTWRVYYDMKEIESQLVG